MLDLGKWGRAIVAVLMATLGALGNALGVLGPGAGLGDLSLQTWIVTIGLILGSGAVTALVENSSHAAKIKMWIAALGALLASFAAALDDHVITQSEIIVAVTAAVAASGLVYQTNGPAVSSTPTT